MAAIDRSKKNVKKMDAIARPLVVKAYKAAGIDNPVMIEHTIKNHIEWLLAKQREAKENAECARRIAKMPASKKQKSKGITFRLDEDGEQIINRLSVKGKHHKIDFPLLYIQREIKARQALEGLHLKPYKEIKKTLAGLVNADMNLQCEMPSMSARRANDKSRMELYGPKRGINYQVEALESYFADVRKYGAALEMELLEDRLDRDPLGVIGYGHRKQ